MTSSLVHKGKESQSSINNSNQTPPEPTEADIHQPWNKNVPSKLKSGAAKRRAEKRKKRQKGRVCILKKAFPEHEHDVNLKAPHECSNPEILVWVFDIRANHYCKQRSGVKQSVRFFLGLKENLTCATMILTPTVQSSTFTRIIPNSVHCMLTTNQIFLEIL